MGISGYRLYGTSPQVDGLGLPHGSHRLTDLVSTLDTDEHQSHSHTGCVALLARSRTTARGAHLYHL